MTGGFDPGRYTTAPLQTEGVIRFTGSLDAVFARIANHGALTDWVPMLKTVQVSHPKSLPPGESMIGTTRVLALRGGVTLREEIVYWDPPRCYTYTTEGNHWPIRSYLGFVGIESAADGGTFQFREYFSIDGRMRRVVVTHAILLLGSRALHNLSKLIGGTSVEVRHVPTHMDRSS